MTHTPWGYAIVDGTPDGAIVDGDTLVGVSTDAQGAAAPIIGDGPIEVSGDTLSVQTAGGALVPIMTPEELSVATGGRLSATEDTVRWAIGAYGDAMRTMCGWHICPSLRCRYVADGGRVAQLPAMHVSDVISVTVGGEEVDPSAYEWTPVGLVRFARPCAATRAGWHSVSIDYVAGIDDARQLQATLVALVSEYLVANPGISSQTAGGTQVSYSASVGVRSHYEELAPYRLVT